MGAFLTGSVVSISGAVTGKIDTSAIVSTDDTVNIQLEVTYTQLNTTYTVPANKVLLIYDVVADHSAYLGTANSVWAGDSTNQSRCGIFVDDVAVWEETLHSNNSGIHLGCPIVATAGQTVKIKFARYGVGAAANRNCKMRGFLQDV